MRLIRLVTTFGALACAALVAPVAASAHQHHHFLGVFLKGTVASVDPGSHTLVVSIDKASRKGAALVGHDVTVKAIGGFVADVNGDGRHNLSDVGSGDTVIVWTFRRFIDFDANRVAAAKIFDKTHPPAFFRSSDSSTGDHHCDGDRWGR